MRLASLKVTQLPGVDTPFSLRGVSAGVTVVVGPNASGKSSLVRAVRALWNSQVHAGDPVHVEGEFRQDLGGVEVAWRATRMGAVISWERDGVKVEPPPPPPDHLLNSYLVSIETLIQNGPTDVSIGNRLRREMSGGYDISAAREATTEQLRGHRLAARSLAKATRDLDDLVRQRSALHQQQLEQGELMTRQARAAKQAADLPLYRQAFDLKAYLAERELVGARLAGMPTALRHLAGSEDDELVELRSLHATAAERLTRARRKAAEAEAAVEATGLASARLDRAAAEASQADADVLAELAAKAAQNDSQVAELQAALRAPWRRLGGRPKGPLKPAFEAKTLDEVEQLLGERLAATGQLDAAQSEAQALDDASRGVTEQLWERAPQSSLEAEPYRAPDDEGDLTLSDEQLGRARANLSNWLAAALQQWKPVQARALLGPGLLLLVAAALFLAAAVVALSAPGGSPDLPERAVALGPAFLVPLASGAVAVIAGLFWLLAVHGRIRGATRYTSAATSEAAAAEVAYARTGARAPSEWSHQWVGLRLQELIAVTAERQAAAAQRALILDRLEAVKRRARAAEVRLKAVSDALSELARATGYDVAAPGVLGAGFAAWLRDVRQFDQLESRLQAEGAARRALEQRADEVYRRLVAGLQGTPFQPNEPISESSKWHGGAWQHSKLGQAAELRAATKRLLWAVTQRDQAQADLQRAEADSSDAQDAIRAAADRWGALLKRCGVQVTSADDPTSPAAMAQAEAQVYALLAQRPAFLEDHSRLRELEALVRAGEASLADSPLILNAALTGDASALEQGRQEAERAADHQHQLSQQIGVIDGEVRVAEQGRALERARAQVELAGREVGEHLARAQRNVALDVIFADVEQEHRVKRQPKVLERAQEWFARFTHGDFTLEFDPTAQEGERLRARDAGSGRLLQPAQLSTGTRAQLLLALRVAHATYAEEGGTKLPFFLDEALTTADAGRFAQVATSLLELAQDDGRQIIYLSAREEDARAWRRVAEENDVAGLVSVIDLADVRNRRSSID